MTNTGTSSRLTSLDVFRGFTVAGMIMVNNPGSWATIYPPLEHAKWHGCTPTDLVFPFFLFIVGVAITISLGRKKEQGVSHNSILFGAAKRSAILIGLGLFTAAFPFYFWNSGNWVNLETLRIPGVLQRIGVVYFIASFLFLKFDIKWQAIIGAALLILYWPLMTLIPIPGIGMPDINDPLKVISSYIDNLLLHGHMWGATKVWDPEGIVSTLPAISTTLSGIMLGHLLRSKLEQNEKAAWIFFGGTSALLTGYLWSLAFPLNKALWTSSYVVYTAGLALLIFGFCYWLIDVKGYSKWTKPFVVYGTNAITVFVASGLMAKLMGMIRWQIGTTPEGDPIQTSVSGWIYTNIFLSLFTNYNASLAFALTYVAFWGTIVWWMHNKKIFIKI